MPKRCEIILYPEDGWTSDKIVGVLTSKQSVKDYALILHDKDTDANGDIKKPHYHVYMGFGTTNVQFKHVSSWFHSTQNSVNKVETNKYYLLQYYLHINCPEKHQYSIDEMTANFDVRLFLATKQRGDSLQKIIEQCADGTITPYNYDRYIDPMTYAKSEHEIRRAWTYAEHQQNNALSGQRECSTIWVCGPSGVGKTTICRLYAQTLGLPFYVAATGKDPLSHYTGQPVLILDDFRAEAPFSYVELLKVLDPHYSCPLQSRYRNKILRCSLIFVSSVFSPADIVAQYMLHQLDSGVQLYRRLAEVWYMMPDTIDISRYDLDTHTFVHQMTKPNPVPAYLATLDKASNQIDSSAVLSALSAQYTEEATKLSDTQGDIS